LRLNPDQHVDGAVTSWQVRHVPETGSTNADLVKLAKAGEPEGAVLVADHQTAGRGRHGRSWRAPPGTGLAVSLLLRPAAVPVHQWPWLPLLAGIAVVEALRVCPGISTTLKWPNDVLVGPAKLAGILVERVDGASGTAAVVGIGLNVSAAPDGATSLLAAGIAEVSTATLLATLLDVFGARYGDWRDAGGDPNPWLAAAYRGVCDTLGRDVEATLPGREPIVGRAVDIDATGRLVIRTDSGAVAVGAGEVTHLRLS
jgi:BirA family transcriptional regulator, biotin operon repressor / biotin---[acetyl-CoA-carboxylase] ligase